MENLNCNEAPKGFQAIKAPHKIEGTFLGAVRNKCNLCEYRQGCVLAKGDCFPCMSYSRQDKTGVIFIKSPL